MNLKTIAKLDARKLSSAYEAVRASLAIDPLFMDEVAEESRVTLADLDRRWAKPALDPTTLLERTLDGPDHYRYAGLRILCEAYEGTTEPQVLPVFEPGKAPIIVGGDLTVESNVAFGPGAAIFVLGSLDIKGWLDADDWSMIAARNITFRSGLSEGELLALETIDGGKEVFLHGNDYSCRAKRFVAGTLVDFERYNAFSVVEVRHRMSEWSYPRARAALGIDDDNLEVAFRAKLQSQSAPTKARKPAKTRKFAEEHKADIRDDDLYDAARTSLTTLTKLLTEKQWSPDCLSIALRFAAQFDQPECVSTLLAKGATDPKRYALAAAVESSVDSLRLLMKAGELTVDARVSDRPMLHLAVTTDSKSVFQWLLDDGADVNAEDGITALHIAAFHGRDDMVKKLLAAGAQIDKQATCKSFMADAGETALDVAERRAKMQKSPSGPWSKIARMMRKPPKVKVT